MKKRLGKGFAEEKLKAEVERLAGAHYAAFIRGVQRYQASPYKRNLAAPRALWREGTTRLLDFGASKSGRPVLVIPSLINRYHVLDIEKDHSFLRALAKRGFRPLLVDWGVPDQAEKDFAVDDYVKRLQKALALAHKLAGGPVPLVGYCMGGLFAMALAQLAPEKIAKLVFLATPWDFHAGGDRARLAVIAQQIMPALKDWNELPVDVMQAFFVMIAPFAVIDKFVRFHALAPKSAAARSFVLLEDWVNNGVPLPQRLARDCLQSWYVDNDTLRGAWTVMGKKIRPSQCSIPTLHVIPERDRIVPPQSAEALAKLMPHATVLKPHFGHVSMMAHREAAQKCWPAIVDWLAQGKARH